MLFQQVRPRVLVSGMGVSRARVDPDRVTKRVLEPAAAPRQRETQGGEQGQSAGVRAGADTGSGPEAAERLAELAEREAVIRGLIAGSPFAMIAMDTDGRLTEFNAAAEELSGHQRDEALGMHMPGIRLQIPQPSRTCGRILVVEDDQAPGKTAFSPPPKGVFSPSS